VKAWYKHDDFSGVIRSKIWSSDELQVHVIGIVQTFHLLGSGAVDIKSRSMTLVRCTDKFLSSSSFGAARIVA